jgi:hypothetical protein
MSRGLRFWSVIAVVTALAVVTPMPAARASRVHTGTIIGGVLTTAPTMDCELVADCLAWVASGCDPALATLEPAWQTSIDDVNDLAGSDGRVFSYAADSPAGFVGGGVVVQFWTRQCVELRYARWRAYVPYHTFRRTGVLSIPDSAVWMTVTGSENVNIAWRLR